MQLDIGYRNRSSLPFFYEGGVVRPPIIHGKVSSGREMDSGLILDQYLAMVSLKNFRWKDSKVGYET